MLIGDRVFTEDWKRVLERERRRQLFPSATYPFEFAFAFLERRTGRIKSIENLRWLSREQVKGNAKTYVVQVLDYPCDISILKIYKANFVRFPMDVHKLIGKPG